MVCAEDLRVTEALRDVVCALSVQTDSECPQPMQNLHTCRCPTKALERIQANSEGTDRQEELRFLVDHFKKAGAYPAKSLNHSQGSRPISPLFWSGRLPFCYWTGQQDGSGYS